MSYFQSAAIYLLLLLYQCTAQGRKLCSDPDAKSILSLSPAETPILLVVWNSMGERNQMETYGSATAVSIEARAKICPSCFSIWTLMNGFMRSRVRVFPKT